MSPPVLPSLDVSRGGYDDDGAGSERAFTPSFGRGGSQKSERLRALSRDRASADAAWEEHNRVRLGLGRGPEVVVADAGIELPRQMHAWEEHNGVRFGRECWVSNGAC